jgi:HlyD family type I secretion membrane fusion protein
MTAVETHADVRAFAALQMPPDDGAQRREWRRQVRGVLLPVAVAALLVAAWTFTAPLAGAVVAPASVKVELNRKTVQHQEGGIVREILVRDGQQVHAGDALLVVADLRSEADLGVLQDRWRATRARIARAEAEALNAARFEAPPDLAADAAATEHMERERALFSARRQAFEEQTALLHAQVREAQAQAAALESQIEATSASARLSDEELSINVRLADDGYVHRTRLIGLQRIVSDYRSRVGEHRSELASARQRAGELQARLAQLRQQRNTQATDEVKEAAALLREIEEKLRPSLDHVDRQVVRAPVDGAVMGLRVASVGAAIAPREALLDVVPAREKLVVVARIAPQDIEHVQVNGSAQVRLLGADAHNQPQLPASVVFVSPDRVSDPQSGAAWFEVTVEVDTSTLKHQRLHAGMPAELYITTAQRTLFAYLAKPLNVFAQRALREP